jgi:DNA-binding SARP family transcriptional activator
VDHQHAAALPLRFVLAGPVQAWFRDEPIALGPPQRRALLATLLLGAGRVIGPDRLVDAIWGADPPANPQSAVQAHVSVLRRILEPGRAPREESRILRSVGGGYLLDVVGMEVDLFLFRHRLAAARAAGADGSLERAAALLRTALDGWDGVALTGLPGPMAEVNRVALREERLAAFEELVELELTRGRPEVRTVELHRLLRENPHRERLHGLRMRGLHREGRRAEALALYAELRARLVADLGIEPGPELRALQRQILAEDTLNTGDLPVVPLRGPSAPQGRVSSAFPPAEGCGDARSFRAPDALPATVPDLVGRDHVLDRLSVLLLPAAPRPVVLHGLPCVGTTAAAVAAVARVAGRFAGEVHLVASGRTVPGALPGGSLLVLDGVHGEPDLDERLGTTPGAGTSAVARLVAAGTTVLIAGTYRMRRLTPVQRVQVDPLTFEQSWELFARHVGHERVDREPAAVGELLRRIGGLPLMLVANATQLDSRPSWSVAEYCRDLAAQQAADPDWIHDLGIGPFLGHSFAAVDQDALEVLCAGALLDRPEFSRDAVRPLCPVQDRQQLITRLARLVDHHLLAEPAPGTYRFHPLIREYSLALARTPAMWARLQRFGGERARRAAG